eukprot:1618142-Alexandrium_andersonii.AAC.1
MSRARSTWTVHGPEVGPSRLHLRTFALSNFRTCAPSLTFPPPDSKSTCAKWQAEPLSIAETPIWLLFPDSQRAPKVH